MNIDKSFFSSLYATEIFELAEKKVDKIFYNSSSDHAMIVHLALVKNASQYIDILSGSMCSIVSNNESYRNQIKTYLEQEGKPKINIMLTDYDESFVNKDIARLLTHYPLQVTVKRIKGQFLYKGKPIHFTVSDDRAFRLETDIDKRMAFGNFNSPAQATMLKSEFDKVFTSPFAERINLGEW